TPRPCRRPRSPRRSRTARVEHRARVASVCADYTAETQKAGGAFTLQPALKIPDLESLNPKPYPYFFFGAALPLAGAFVADAVFAAGSFGASSDFTECGLGMLPCACVNCSMLLFMSLFAGVRISIMRT